MTQAPWTPRPGAQPLGYAGGYGPGGWNQGGYRPPPYGQHGPGLGSPGLAPYPQRPAPRRRNPLGRVLLGLIVLAGLALTGLVASNLMNGSSNVAYQNDDYQVPPPDTNPPPLPLPQTYTEAEDWLTNSAFYRQRTPVPVRCDNPPVSVAGASDARLKEHFEGLMECLVRVWEPPVTGADFTIVRPTVTIYGREITTKCGRAGVNAFYCSADQQVYFSSLLPSAIEIVQTDRWAADVVMAHEFGHALQGRTGLLVSAHAFAQNADSKAQSNEILRRLEQQADCFSGMFISSVSRSLGIRQSDLDGIEQTYVAVGDDTLTGERNVDGNHGLAKSRLYWGTTGLGTDQVGQCNTFTAPSSRVR